MEVTDAYGRTVLKKKGMSNLGINNVDLNLSHSSNGLYVISILYKDGERKTVKLIKTN